VSASHRSKRSPLQRRIRFAGGQNSELWHVMDTLGMMLQLGILPGAPAQAGASAG
jgi:hypothetical protein